MADTLVQSGGSRANPLGIQRRELIASLAAGAGAAIVAPPAAARATQADAKILIAWQRRQDAYTTYMALPDDEEPEEDGYGPRERELWAIIDDAESDICETVATTPRGAMIQLWCAMYHNVSSREAERALTRGDFAAIDDLDLSVPWGVQLMLAAIRSLQAMEA